MEIKFSSCEELYRRITPALRTRVREFRSDYLYTIDEDDIWNYLRAGKWRNENGLTLASMVNDILNVDSKEILDYLKDHKND